MLWLELQEGKDRMRNKLFQQELGASAACVLRGVKATEGFMNAFDPCGVPDQNNQLSPRLYLGDSWFGSVRAAVAIAKAGHHACFMIKTAHSKSPKKFLEEQMASYPGGTWITMEAKVEGIDLVCIGYKYNKKKVLTFVLTKGAGSSKPGEPYEAKFPDKFGNVCIRHISRPQVLSLYFTASNKVDLHNQARQYELSLEKKWVTTNPYFRLYTTLVGMNVTDAWKCMRKKYKSLETIADFVNILCRDMIDRSKEDIEMLLPEVSMTHQSSPTISSVSCEKIHRGEHTRVYLKNKKQVRCIWCSRVDLIEKKTTMKCLECDFGFCRAGSCWSHHVALDGVPAAPKKGTKKRKLSDL